MKKYDAIIIGGGAAGMSATKTLANQNKSVLLIETEAVLGGVLNQCIHSGFGVEYYQEDLTGPTFANRLANELKETSATIELGSHVLSVNEDKEVEYTNETGYYKVCAKAIIFALGSLERSAGAIALPGKRLNGIHTAGSAQQYINMEGNLVGKKIFILGSGDIGLIMARRMHLEGAKILGVAEMMPYSNGLARNIAQCLNDFDIPLYLSHVVSDCRGDDNLSQVEICEIDEQFNLIKGTEKQFDVDTLLLAVGLIPINTLYKMLNLEIDNKTKSIKVDSNYQTSLPGFFSCGNCLHVHDIVDFAAIEGEIAATYCNKYILDQLENNVDLIEIELNENISYSVPQYIDLKNTLEEVTIFFRVKRIYKKAMIRILFDDVEYRKIRKKILLPAEMEQIKLPKSDMEFRKIKILVEEIT